MKQMLLLLDKALRRWMPDPFVIAIVLTALTFVLAIICVWRSGEPSVVQSGMTVVDMWGGGFWNLAKFTLQMAMILIGGYVVAIAPPVQAILLHFIRLVRTPVQAVVFCTLIAIAASWINWGFGLVVGGIAALEVHKQLPRVPFRMLVASSYSGFLVWHAGLSASIPLAINTEDDPSLKWTQELIPLDQTIFSSFNLIALGLMVVLLPLINVIQLSMLGDEETTQPITAEPESTPETSDTGSFLDDNVFVIGVLFAMAVFYWSVVWLDDRFKLDLNSINFLFFMVGMVLHGSPRRFVDAVHQATPKVAPILIQYPLYAGIMAMLSDSGLAKEIARWFVQNSTPETFPLMTFYSAGLLNVFVPSGGGQWAVQAPIVVTAANELGVSVPRVALAVAWGDAWTNLLQPFWAIPLLTIAGLSIKDIIGFCLVTLLASGAVLSLLFLFL